MLSALVAFSLAAAPFPLPLIDGKQPAVTKEQRTFRLPMRFEKAKAFYEEQFKGAEGVSLRVEGALGNRTLKLSTRNVAYAWVGATVKEGELETVVELKTVIVAEETVVSGNGPPVQFILTRSPEVERSLKSIDHTEQMRGK